MAGEKPDKPSGPAPDEDATVVSRDPDAEATMVSSSPSSGRVLIEPELLDFDQRDLEWHVYSPDLRHKTEVPRH